MKTICKHCGEPIEPTGGQLYLYTHVDPDQQKCTIAAPADGSAYRGVDLIRLHELLSLIAKGMTIPGYKGPHPDERIAMLQEVMHAAQTYAKEALSLIGWQP